MHRQGGPSASLHRVPFDNSTGEKRLSMGEPALNKDCQWHEVCFPCPKLRTFIGKSPDARVFKRAA